MNTNPDETTLALWLEDELHGDELAAMNAWAEQHPEQLAAREEVRRWRNMMAAALPASEEPPYAEFFNARIATAIRRQQTQSAAHPPRGFSWQSLFMPLAACAGMALTFWLGTQTRPGPPDIDVTGAPKAIPVEPILYTPERGVKAEWFASVPAAADVIVLNGLSAIPDSMDLSATTAIGTARDIHSTASLRQAETETANP
jgi:hypothetical protein